MIKKEAGFASFFIVFLDKNNSVLLIFLIICFLGAKLYKILYIKNMNWFNFYGLLIIFVILIPNIMYASVNKQNKSNCYKNKFVILLEQVGRYGCMFFKIFNIPLTYFNFWFDNSFYVYVYVGVNGVLCLAYIIFWIICWNKNNLLKALSLSIIPKTKKVIKKFFSMKTQNVLCFFYFYSLSKFVK